MKNILLLIPLICCLCCSCSGDDTEKEIIQTEKLMISKFLVRVGDTDIEADINQSSRKINATVPIGTNIKALQVKVTYTEGAVLQPESNYSYNFSQPVTFKLTKGDLTISYEVIISTQPEILSFDVPAYHIKGEINGDKINVTFNYGTDLAKIIPQIKIADGCTITPASGKEVDLSTTVTYIVSNANGFSKSFTVNATLLPQEQAVRGVWVPDPTHTDVLNSFEKLQDFINLLDELNINTIFVAAWVREQTLFKSHVLKENTNYSTIEEGWLLNGSNYNGPSGDVIKDLITEAHKKSIKVFFWFEYGFMRSGGQNPPANHPILSVHPDWDGRNNQNLPANYNGTDYYLNSYDTDVQEFLIRLMEEAVEKYPDVDGIQGDDRLPASPRNSGYNDVTKQAYKSETGKDVPNDYSNIEWVQWRLSKLNEFCHKWSQRLRNKKRNLIIASSPNPYPWCVNNLMQDWPSWLKNNDIDLLSVQCYRETSEAYRATLNETLQYVNQNTSNNILNPGIYLRNTSEWESIFVNQMQYNRDCKTNGETFFFNEGLKRDVNKKVIKSFYTGKALFPF